MNSPPEAKIAREARPELYVGPIGNRPHNAAKIAREARRGELYVGPIGNRPYNAATIARAARLCGLSCAIKMKLR